MIRAPMELVVATMTGVAIAMATWAFILTSL
jgi:hypothetical protein